MAAPPTVNILQPNDLTQKVVEFWGMNENSSVEKKSFFQFAHSRASLSLFSLSVCVSVCISVCLSVCQSVSLSVCLFLSLSVSCLSVCLSPVSLTLSDSPILPLPHICLSNSFPVSLLLSLAN